MSAEPTLQGEMYLFERPELLDATKHGHMGLVATEGPFRFAADAWTVPILVSEIATAQKHYPVVFSSIEDPVLLAVLGLEDGPNLFVDAAGNWEPGCYIPAYLRSYPFGFAEAGDDRVAVIIDAAASAVSDTPAEPFFDNDRLSAATQAKVDLFSRMVAERRKTRDFCRQVVETGLLAGQQAAQTVDGEQRSIAKYVSVDAAGLEALDAERLWDIHRRGLLAAIYAHIFSLDNWNALLDRHAARGGGSPDA